PCGRGAERNHEWNESEAVGIDHEKSGDGRRIRHLLTTVAFTAVAGALAGFEEIFAEGLIRRAPAPTL
ncbi:MAG: hypothetical protein ABMA00_04890, partial [Gemmatimonas sp.]